MNAITQPRRRYLGTETAEILRREIAAGRWIGSMPSERHLLSLLSVSRVTLREALKELVADGILTVVPRRGYHILRKPRGTRHSDRPIEVGVLCPEQVSAMPPFVGQILDGLRAHCAPAGIQFDIFEERRLQRMRPSRFLTGIIEANPKSCWVLLMANEAVQKWFSRRGERALIYGHAYDGVRLACLGPDFRACVRHGTAHLLARGHRRIALVTYDPVFAGERESIQGFTEAVDAHRADRIKTFLVHERQDDPAELSRAVSRLMRMAERPTAFVVCRNHHYLTVSSQLALDGFRVPRDVSLISRSDDAFLHFVRPAPATYRLNLEKLTRQLFQLLQKELRKKAPSDLRVRIPPDFFPGESVGRAPPDTS